MTEPLEKREGKIGYLEDDRGNPSSMRLMSFVALMSSIIFGFLTLFIRHDDGTNGVFITFGFLIAAFAPKALQKFAEIKLK